MEELLLLSLLFVSLYQEHSYDRVFDCLSPVGIAAGSL